MRKEDNYLSPERVLFTAAAAPDLHLAPDTVLQAVPHHVVAFTWRRWPVRLFLNAYTGLPTGREITPTRARRLFSNLGRRAARGPVLVLDAGPDGRALTPCKPTSSTTAGWPRTTLVTALTLNVATPADSFAVPRPVQQAYQARKAALTAPPPPIARRPPASRRHRARRVQPAGPAGTSRSSGKPMAWWYSKPPFPRLTRRACWQPCAACIPACR